MRGGKKKPARLICYKASRGVGNRITKREGTHPQPPTAQKGRSLRKSLEKSVISGLLKTKRKSGGNAKREPF